MERHQVPVMHAATPNGNYRNVLAVVSVIAILYFARLVLIPLALAVLLAFLLVPLKMRLRRLGLGRIPAVVLVLLFSFTIVAAATVSLGLHVSGLVAKLPHYEENVRKKLDSIQASGGVFVTRFSNFIHRFSERMTPPPPPEDSGGLSNEEKPVPVEIRKAPFSPIEMIQGVLGSVLHIALTATVVVVFVIFILFQREDLRDRLIRLAGRHRIGLTTEVFEDATRRVSRFLMAQLALNFMFGVMAAIGLYFMGVPDAIFWGLLAVLLRYVPYLGIWVAALLPAAFAFAFEPGWYLAPAIFVLYFAIDLLVINFIEPLVYGTSTGISPLAVLVAAVFWTWLWGPVGLLLSTPLTVCVVVLGRYVPSLQFLQVMLGDEKALTPETRFYQRVLASDLDEATDIAEEHAKGKSLQELFDEVVIPALSLADEQRHRARPDLREVFYENMRLLIEDFFERADDILKKGKEKDEGPAAAEVAEAVSLSDVEKNGKGAAVLCIPAHDESDELGAQILAGLLRRQGIEARAPHQRC
jgi:predicted PurR-regulated permease PerM